MSGHIDPVIHFEIPAGDPARLKTFYERVFGWQTATLGPEMGGFVLAFTGETDEKTRLPRKRGFINGGIYRRERPNQQVKVTILVDDIRAAIAKVREAGGTVSGEPVEMPGVGLFADFADPDGNHGTLNQDFTIGRL